MKDGEAMNVTEKDLETTARLSRLAIPADETAADALACLGDFLT